MTTRHTLFLFAPFCMSLSACGQHVRPKLQSIDVMVFVGDDSMHWRTEFSYDQNRLDSVEHYSDGAMTHRREIYYVGDQVETIERLSPAGRLFDSVDFWYSHSQLGGSTWSNGYRTIDTSYRYEGELAFGRSWQTFSANGTVTERGSVRHRYDEQNRLERTVIAKEDSNVTRMFRYGDGEAMSEIDSQYEHSRDAHTFNTAFDYDGQQRLQGVAQSVRQCDITYDAAFISEIVESWGAPAELVKRTRYTYGEGEVDGFFPTPDVPHGELFDMAGGQFKAPEPMTLGEWIY